jgi:hypothetical protein
MPSPSKEDFERLAAGTPDYNRLFAKVVARVWTEPDFEKEFNADPAKVLRANGIPVPPGVVLSRSEVMIPAKPVGIDDEALKGTGGAGFSTLGTYSSFSCPGCTAGCAGSAGCKIEEPIVAR